MILISYSILVLQTGLRWETGTDWNPYFDHFESFDGLLSIVLSPFEIGYSLIVLLFRLFTANYSIFLLFNAMFYYFLIYKSFNRYSHNQHLSLMLFYSLSIGVMGSNRQLIALAICIYAIKFIKEKKPILFFLLVTVAIFFHTTAFFFYIYYFLDRRINPLILIFLLFCSIVLGKTQFPEMLFSGIGNLLGGHAAEKVMAYSELAADTLAEQKLSVIGLFKRIVFLMIFYYNSKYLNQKLPYYNVMLNGYFVGIIIYFFFSNTLLIMVNRGSLYFNMMEPLLLASQVLILKDKATKFVGLLFFLILSFLFLFQSIALYPDLFDPYKGVFINTEFQREMY